MDQLKELLSDSNPMVVANAVAALSEINEASSTGYPLIEINSAIINKVKKFKREQESLSNKFKTTEDI